MKNIIAIVAVALCLTGTAVFCWADEEKDHVCFSTLDADKDGQVTFKEFAEVYGEDRQKFDQADKDKNGHLSHDEYHGILGHGSS